MDYLYDGTFDGFLSCVYRHYYEEKASDIVEETQYQKNFLFPSVIVTTDGERAGRVSQAITEKISDFALRRIFYVFLSNHPKKEMLLLQYICLGFRLGGKINSLHGNSIVFEVQQTERKVTGERHRLLGLLRFSSLVSESGREILYAPVKPDHDVIRLMADHFGDRLGGQAFVIHDLRREKALFCQDKEWYEAPLSRQVPLNLSQDEKLYRKLWKHYFEAIAIEQRKNPVCQKTLMPVRYWENLTEMR